MMYNPATEQTKQNQTTQIITTPKKEKTTCFAELYDCINQISMYDGLALENNIASRAALRKLKTSIVHKVLERCKKENVEEMNKDITEQMKEDIRERLEQKMCNPKDWLEYLQMPPMTPIESERISKSKKEKEREEEEEDYKPEQFPLMENILSCFMEGMLKAKAPKALSKKDRNLYKEVPRIVAKFNPRSKGKAKRVHLAEWKHFIQKHVDACVQAENKSRKSPSVRKKSRKSPSLLTEPSEPISFGEFGDSIRSKESVDSISSEESGDSTSSDESGDSTSSDESGDSKRPEKSDDSISLEMSSESSVSIGPILKKFYPEITYSAHGLKLPRALAGKKSSNPVKITYSVSGHNVPKAPVEKKSNSEKIAFSVNGHQVPKARVGKKSTNEESGDSTSSDESGDSISLDVSGDSISLDESGDSICLNVCGDSNSPEESDDSISLDVSGDSISLDVSGDSISLEESSVSISSILNKSKPEKITYSENGLNVHKTSFEKKSNNSENFTPGRKELNVPKAQVEKKSNTEKITFSVNGHNVHKAPVGKKPKPEKFTYSENGLNVPNKAPVGKKSNPGKVYLHQKWSECTESSSQEEVHF